MPLTSPPLFSVTRNTTGTPAGCRASVSCTTSGLGSTRPRRRRSACSPTRTATAPPVAATRVTVTVAVALLPDRSVARACIVFGPSASGTFAARKLRFATCAATPLTVTVACCGVHRPDDDVVDQAATLTVGGAGREAGSPACRCAPAAASCPASPARSPSTSSARAGRHRRQRVGALQQRHLRRERAPAHARRHAVDHHRRCAVADRAASPGSG